MNKSNIEKYCKYCNKKLIGHNRLRREFCNKQCYYNSLNLKTIHRCLNCGNNTTNPKFCSSSCSASYNNRQKPKRRLSKQCPKCNTLIPSTRKYCNNCYVSSRFMPSEDITLQQAINMRHHTSSAYALVRTRARKVIQIMGINTCQKCGYSKHIEVCHIKAISSFDKNTLLSVINDIDNLIALCPNCHWEFDHQ